MIQDIEELYRVFNESFYQQQKIHKCEYCGKPDMNANCHAHKDWCPYSCNHQNNVPIGDVLLPLSIFIILYTIIKKVKLWKQLKKNGKF